MSILLSNQMKEFINETRAMGIGTRDADFTPTFARVIGIKLLDDSIFKILIAKQTSELTLKNLEDNKMIAFVIVNPLGFECYQFKGNYLRSYEASDEDRTLVENWLKDFDDIMVKYELEVRITYNLLHDPIVAIEFEIEQIFEQTPKIGTGNPITT